MDSQQVMDITDQKWKILIVGEEETVVRLIQDTLRNKFNLAEFIVASDGPAGFRIAMAELPDLLLLNVNSPKTNGRLVCEKLKMDEHATHIPVIMLAQKEDHNEVHSAYEAGAEAIVGKPIDKNILLRTATILLDWRRTHQQQVLANQQLMESFRVLANIADLSEKLLTVTDYTEGLRQFDLSLASIGFEGTVLFAEEQADRDSITLALEKGLVTEKHDGSGSIFVLPFKAMKKYGLVKIQSQEKINRNQFIDVFKMYRDLLISFTEKCVLWDRQNLLLSTVQGTVQKIRESAGKMAISDKLLMTSGDIEKLGNNILDKIDIIYKKQGLNEDIATELMDIQMASQDFDRLGQKIKYILELFENVVKIAEGREGEIIRDRSLFSGSKTDQHEIDKLIGGL